MAARLLGFVVAVIVVAGGAHAEESASWRSAYREGTRLYDVGEYKAALDAFKRAYLAHEDAGILFSIGECHEQLGAKVEAAHAYRGYLRKQPDARNRAEVEAKIAQLEGTAASSAPSARPTSPSPPAAPPPTGPSSSAPPPAAPPPTAPPPAAPSPPALPPHGSVYDPWGGGTTSGPPPMPAPSAPPAIATTPTEPAPATPPAASAPSAMPPAMPTTTSAPAAAAWAPSVERTGPPPRRSKAWIAAVVVPCAAVLAVVIGVSAWYAQPSPSYTRLSPVQ